MSTPDGSCTERLVETVTRIRNQITRLNEAAEPDANPVEALDEVDRIARESMECISDGSIVIDNGQRIVSLSESAEKRLKVSTDAVHGRLLFDAFPEMHSPFIAEQLVQALSGRNPTDFVALFDAPLPGWHEVRVFPTGSGAELYFHAISREESRDGMARQPLHDAARSALRACRRSVGGTRGRVLLFNEPAVDAEVITVNPSHIQRPFDSLFAAERCAVWSRAAATRGPVVSAGGARENGEAPRGSLLCVPLIIDATVIGMLELDGGPKAFTEEDGNVAASIAQCFSRSAKPGAQPDTERGKSGEAARSLFNSRGAAVYMTTFAGRIIDANQVTWERLGYTREELLTLSSRALYSHNCSQRLNAHVRTLRRTGHAVCEAEHVRKDGTLLPVELDSLLITCDEEPAVLTVARDIQRQKSMEALRAQSRKMEAASDLAKGIAHDFGDIASSILGRIDLLLTESDLAPDVTRHLRDMKKEAQRATDLTLRLLASRGKRSAQPRLVDLNALVGGMEQRIARLIDERAVLVTHVDPAVGSVLVDPSLLEQAVIELALIAREALCGNGEITLSTRAVRADEAPLRLHPEADFVDHVALMLRATGDGIDEAALQHIHEPFFTATTQERGSAMGLASVYGIVKQLGGFIEADGSRVNGATFRVFLPSFTSLAPTEGVLLPEATLRARSAGVILLVEKDASIRQREEGVLRQSGFAVACASHVEEAFTALTDGRIVLAAVAPASHGGKMALELARRFPEAGLLLVAEEREPARDPGAPPAPRRLVLRRPFSLRELTLMVWELAGHGRE